MDVPTSLGIIILAGLIHASFQLSISMITLLSGHAIGSHTATRRTMRLVGAFLGGVVVMTMLSVSFLGYAASQLFRHDVPPIIWSVVSGLMIGLGIAVWAFYYRRRVGTSLWVPRSFARVLIDRTKATRHSVESFSLGLTSVIAEGLFIIAPASAAALAMISFPAPLQLVGVGLYTLTASLGILIVVVLIGSGHKLSRIQKWREDNKRFLQFAAGSALLVLGFYLYVNAVVATAVVPVGGF
jgi:hypothetical protein